jgi:hypothetical protein
MEKQILKTTCSMCGKEVKVEVNKEDLKKYQEGIHIQDAFPYLTADEREVFISGICGECFDRMFK